MLYLRSLKITGMDIRLEKLELMELLINTNEVSVLQKIRKIFEDEETGYSGQLSEDQYQKVFERREEYLKAEGEYFSFEEVEKRIDARLKS
ncbi:hypothetical protein BAX94_00410 [Elizabethkingia meningoseptica]|uniref:Addiction module protein n=2 Tax=Weeksellaceae TaxID=2762318 RepID=A0A1V3U3G9_ELIME|nr:hypothetical protein BBD33_08610 [Elizabethkingia meningoseptica]AQX12869.1 hypothetical protein BBD35_11025 [Elizabethkingia meningoseptica]AQX47346.1 hypothetical protein B5G46_08600 [Elizabethkingia meningoseptica]KUY24390.1 hypothetical protein ATB99_02510 [Elizabethkingia meningoseptica]ODM55329.1 hypothetical protein BES09_02455 [Elizabethkingia meningoseptica]